MTARFILTLAMLFGIVFVPVRPVAGCAIAPLPACTHCCAADDVSCCAASTAPAPSSPLAPAGNAGEDGKQLVTPTFVFLCLSPIPATEPPAVRRQQAARLPALPLLELNCIRLI